MNCAARRPAFRRTRLRPTCLAVALALGTVSLNPSAVGSHEIATIEASFAQSMRRHTDWPALSVDQRLAIIEQAERRQASLPTVPAGSIAVTNCNDSGPGSYRQALSDADDNDTIDMSSLACSSITLTSGDVIALADNLTLQGPGQLKLTINGDYEHSPLRHAGTGTLTIRDLTLFNGHKYQAPTGIGTSKGGCVATEGTLVLDHAGAKYCEVRTLRNDAQARGGGVYGKNGVQAFNSIIAGNDAVHAGSGGHVAGGGVFSGGPVTMLNSIVTGNQARATGSAYATGGGVSVGSLGSGGAYAPGGSVAISNSTISQNSAEGLGSRGETGGLWVLGRTDISSSTLSGNTAQSNAGLYVLGTDPASSVIENSTISGNRSTFSGTAGVLVSTGSVQIDNSTIAFNMRSGGTGPTVDLPGAGLRIRGGANAVVRSTIISDNTTTREGKVFIDDVGGDGSGAVTGSFNLIPTYSIPVPPDTADGNAMLQPLASNGGPTRTHRLGPASVAIDSGSNPLSLSEDQRGFGYPRVVGAQADIGAFESAGDSIFANGFELE